MTGLDDLVAQVVSGPLVKRLATQRRRDDSGHHDPPLADRLGLLIDFVSSGHRSGVGRRYLVSL